MRGLVVAVLLFLSLVVPLFSQTLITQAMVSAGGPAGYYIIAPGEYVIGSPIVHPYSYGYAIQSGVVWDKSPIVIRNPYGYPIWCSTGPATQAVGVGIYGTTLHWYGRGPESFRINVAARCPPGNLSVGGNHQLIDVTVRSGYYAGLLLEGHDTIYSNVRVLTVGGGTARPERPIGLVHVGDRPRFDGVSIHDVVRGPMDTETMHAHLDRCAGALGRIYCYQRERQQLSFGIWFNACSNVNIDVLLNNVEIGLANDVSSGRITGRAVDVGSVYTPPLGATVDVY